MIALRLGTKSPTRDEYTHERAKMLAADAKRYMHGGQLRLPTDAQAVHALGSWDAALRAAGLQTERPPSKPKSLKHWTRDRCIAAVADYLRDARQDTTRHTTHAGYRNWAKQQEQAPSSDTIRKYGGWSFVQHEAQELLLAQELGIVPRA